MNHKIPVNALCTPIEIKFESLRKIKLDNYHFQGYFQDIVNDFNFQDIFSTSYLNFIFDDKESTKERKSVDKLLEIRIKLINKKWKTRKTINK